MSHLGFAWLDFEEVATITHGHLALVKCPFFINRLLAWAMW
jgi:hypothetical protein